MTWELRQGDCVELMAAMPEASVDAVVCDPPYGLEFMGKEWDRIGRDVGPGGKRRERDKAIEGREGEKWQPGSTYGAPAKNPRCLHCLKLRFDHEARKCQCETPLFHARGGEYGEAQEVWHYRWATEALRILKPGGHLLAFGGTRTYHRLACAVEDAGFEIRDSLLWLYGQGFPKSRNLDGDRQGWGTALKPSHEPIVVARKPLIGTVAENVLRHGTGAINVDGCRIVSAESWAGDDRPYDGSNGFGPGDEDGWSGNWSKRSESHPVGRWPANVVLSPEAAEELDAQSGELHGAGNVRPSARGESGYAGGWGGDGSTRPLALDNGGGASRFFLTVPADTTPPATPIEGAGNASGLARFRYQSKCSRAERNAGLEGFEERESREWRTGNAPPNVEHRVPDKRAQNFHPTVKPINLMRWLVRLVTPPGGTVLDPFLGSGSTGCAAVLEDFDFIGCEREPEYVAIAEARIAFWAQHVGREVEDVLGLHTASEREAQLHAERGQLTIRDVAA